MQTQQTQSDAKAERWTNCLVGTLETWPLSDIILWLHQSRKTAMLRVGLDIRAGVLFFSNGELYRVEWRQRSGEEALIGLLNLTAGPFSLIQRAPPYAQPNIRRPTSELLLQIAVAQDERARAAQA